MTSLLESHVIEAEERLRLAMLKGDVAVLDALIAPELIFTNHLGQVVSKEQDLAMHRARLLKLEKLERSEQLIQLHDGFAVVSVSMHLLGAYEGTPVDAHIRYTRVWLVGRDGVLRISAGHSSSVVTPAV